MRRSTFWSRLDVRAYRWLVVAWMALIFMMSGQPSVPAPAVFVGQDKFMHFLTYGILGFFAFRALGPWGGKGGWRPLAWVTVFCAFYGLTDEFHQSFVAGRDANMGDLLADAFGGFIGAFLVARRQPKVIDE